MDLSIIIPTLNEEEHLPRLLERLQSSSSREKTEITVVDGGSKDKTLTCCRSYEIKTIKTRANRAIQMNTGARASQNSILYFVHADSVPPESFFGDIESSISEGSDLGCYRFRFESQNRLLKINNFFTRFDRSWSRGGDQSLFIRRSVFEALGGFREEYVIMEEYDFLRRARNHGYSFDIIPKDILVSARKYDHNSYLKVQLANLVAYSMFKYGAMPETIMRTYRSMIHLP